MKLRTGLRAAAVGFGLGLFALPVFAQEAPPDHAGRAVYNKTCATCHDNPGTTRAAAVSAIKLMSPAGLREILTTGVMAPMASGLSAQEKTDLIAFLTYGQANSATWTDAIKCAVDKRSVSPSAKIVSAGFGVDQNQTRNLSAAQAGLKKTDLANLEVAWSIAFPGSGGGAGASVLSDGTIFIAGGQQLLALDAKTGCAKWTYAGSTRNTPAIGEIGGRKVVALAMGGDVHVLDASNGALVWKAPWKPLTGAGGHVRGGVIFAKDKVIVPISTSGSTSGANPNFECCTGHGMVVALNAADGKHLWEYHTKPEAEYNGQISSLGVKQKGPSGAAIWSVPVFDAKRNHVIVTTGESTSHPGTDTSNAIIAIDANTGKVAWQYQATTGDVWNLACDMGSGKNGPNCPALFDGDGRGMDFGAGPVVASAGGKDVVLAGQKTGHAWALDAETGKVVWSQRVGEGTALGGVHWGIATDGANLILPISDPLKVSLNPAFVGKAGIYAFDLKTGKPAWSFAAQPDCTGQRATLVVSCSDKFGFSAAPLIVDGAVIGGTLGGQVVIIDARTGALINKLDTVGPITPINKEIAGKGGSIDSHGISAGAGMLFVSSGYSAFGQTGGNALIAYRPKQ